MMLTMMVEQQQAIAGLVSQAQQQYGALCVNQHELACTLIKIRDAVKAKGNREGKGFEVYLAQIGIAKTTAYRFMHSAETGRAIDYHNEPTSSRYGTKWPEPLIQAPKPRMPIEQRAELIRELVSHGLSSVSVAKKLGISDENTRFIANRHGIKFPRVRSIDLVRVMDQTITAGQGIASTIELLKGRIDAEPDKAVEWVKDLREVIRNAWKLIRLVQGSIDNKQGGHHEKTTRCV